MSLDIFPDFATVFSNERAVTATYAKDEPSAKGSLKLPSMRRKAINRLFTWAKNTIEGKQDKSSDRATKSKSKVKSRNYTVIGPRVGYIRYPEYRIRA